MYNSFMHFRERDYPTLLQHLLNQYVAGGNTVTPELESFVRSSEQYLKSMTLSPLLLETNVGFSLHDREGTCFKLRETIVEEEPPRAGSVNVT